MQVPMRAGIHNNTCDGFSRHSGLGYFPTVVGKYVDKVVDKYKIACINNVLRIHLLSTGGALNASFLGAVESYPKNPIL